MAAFMVVLLSLFLSLGCGVIPPPKPPQPPACPEACPLGSECTDPAKGCQPIPAPGPICEEGQTHSCWHWPPDSTSWLYACPVYNPDGEVIGVLNVVAGPGQCPARPPKPPACPEACPSGQECTDPAIGCVPKPPVPPPTGACPWKLSEYPGTYLKAKTNYYGQGLDHTTIVAGSQKYCADRGWTDGRAACQVAIDGDPNKVVCEIEFGRGCPVWEFKAKNVQNPCVDDQNDVMSCDHFGSTEVRDDPKTPTTGTTLETLRGFEGEPKECGLQRDQFGPVAGFFTIAHGIGSVRSCVDASFSACGDWRSVNH